MKRITGQTFIEYVTVLTIVTMAIYGMSTMVKRGTQAMIKGTADLVGDQKEADQQRRSVEDGYMLKSDTVINASIIKERTENLGEITYTYDDVTKIKEDSLVDLGIRD